MIFVPSSELFVLMFRADRVFLVAFARRRDDQSHDAVGTSACQKKSRITCLLTERSNSTATRFLFRFFFHVDGQVYRNDGV